MCKKFPFPLKDGESIAVTYLSHALSDLGCEITLLSMNTTKHYFNLDELPEAFNHYKEIHVTRLDNNLRIKDAIINLFSKESYHVSRFVCPDFKNKLIELLTSNEYDVVQLETLYLAPYIDVIKTHSKALVTMRAHNVEHEIWERISENTRFLPKRLYLKYLTGKLRRYELDHLNDYDYLIAVSERDLKKFKSLGYKNGAMASPIGLDVKNYVKISKAAEKTTDLCFIGALDWMPNMEGLQWFLEKVWPEVHQRHPELKFHIAGRNTPESLLKLNVPNVVVHGEVHDAIHFINAHRVMIVPLFSGSGMRVKILEGMALGKIVVTTTLGKEGIHAENNKHLLIADNPAAFIETIDKIFNTRFDGQAMSTEAIDFVKDFYDHSQNAKTLLRKYQSLIESPAYKH